MIAGTARRFWCWKAIASTRCGAPTRRQCSMHRARKAREGRSNAARNNLALRVKGKIMQAGDRVWLRETTPELVEKGINRGNTGVVREVPGSTDGSVRLLGIEFDGYSDTGWNAGLQVVTINTQREGRTVTVLSLCEPLRQV